MKIVIPYRNSMEGKELRYVLRGIEKFVNNPQITLIGDVPTWIKNITHIPFKDSNLLVFKERNIYEKIKLVEHDFIFFNDDHYLLEPFNFEYHYTGTIEQRMKEYGFNGFSKCLENTLKIFGNIKNYYRHQPIFIKREYLEKINLDWNKEWGYCVKSIYCHLAGVEGVEYPDCKIRTPTSGTAIRKMIEGRPYFSTDERAMNSEMVKVLEELYPEKSCYESVQ